jgi:hypothetical protein
MMRIRIAATHQFRCWSQRESSSNLGHFFDRKLLILRPFNGTGRSLTFDSLPSTRVVLLSRPVLPRGPKEKVKAMASPALGVSKPSANQSDLAAQKLQVEQALKGSSSWFVVIAGLSLVNSVLSMTGASIHFIFGLGLTQIVDALAHDSGGAGIVLDLIINGMIAGVFVFFWHLARKGAKWAFFAGMALYIVDALILLAFKDILSLAFHGWALYRMYSGVKLLGALEQMNRAAANGTISSSI